MVTLLVGEQKIPFHVHMDILCRSSSFFESAFMGSGDFKETSETSMTLPEDDVQAFDNIIQRLYSGKLLNMTILNGKESREQAKEVYLQLAVLYVTADKYDIYGLQNEIIDLICTSNQHQGRISPGGKVIAYIYENSVQNSPFRRLLVQWYAWSIRLDWYSLPTMSQWLSRRPEFAADLAIEMARRASGGNDPWKTDSKRFHESAGDGADKTISNDLAVDCSPEINITNASWL